MVRRRYGPPASKPSMLGELSLPLEAHAAFMFSKPLSTLTYDDILSLTSSSEPEGIGLDYKETVTNSPKHKKELAKDVSAFANSQGGLMVIGVSEVGGKPSHPPAGFPHLLDRQKVEEWIDQVLASNISPRVSVAMRPIEIAGAPDRCLVAIEVPVSVRAPHMVTTDGDNKVLQAPSLSIAAC